MIRRIGLLLAVFVLGVVTACAPAPTASQEMVPTTALTTPLVSTTAVQTPGLSEPPVGEWAFAAAPPCASASVSLDELLEPSIDAEFAVGESDQWIQAGPLSVTAESVDETIPVIGISEEFNFGACVLRSTGAVYAVPWSVVDRDGSTVRLLTTCDVIEPEVELIGDLAVIVLWSDTTTESTPGDECNIDVELGSASAEVRSGLAWPFVEPSDQHFDIVLERGLEPLVRDADLEQATCSVEASTITLSVLWESVPFGVSPEIFRDGVSMIEYPARTAEEAMFEGFAVALEQRLFPGLQIESTNQSSGWRGAFSTAPEASLDERTFEMRLEASSGNSRIVSCGTAAVLTVLPPATCTIELVNGLPRVVIEDGSGADASILRDGVELPFAAWERRVDADVEVGQTYTYSVVRTDNAGSAPPDTIECGSITIEEPSAPGAADLRAAEELFRFAAAGPHAAMEVTPIVKGDFDRTRSVWLTYKNDPDGRLDFDEPQPDLVNPFEVYDMLIAAIDEGRQVEYEINPASGVVVEFTIDGSGQRLSCLSFDTLPPGGAAMCDLESNFELVNR